MHLPSLLANLHYVTPDMARCLQPFTRGQWAAILRKHRFTSILNLRGENVKETWYRDEIASAQASGCRHRNIRLSSRRLPDRAILSELLDAMRTMQKPLLIKCSGGADRTGLAAALYLLDREGPKALPAALRQLRLFPFLHYAKRDQRWIKEFFRYYGLTHGERNLRDWIETTYSPEAFAAHMEAKGNADYWQKE